MNAKKEIPVLEIDGLRLTQSVRLILLFEILINFKFFLSYQLLNI